VKSFIVSGTGTGIGKTLLSALLMSALPEYYYWKPIQAGTEEETDSETVRRLSKCSPERIMPEAYVFSQPLSPHRAAALDNISIDLNKLALPPIFPMIVEGAGGLLVPVTNTTTMIDFFQYWKLPVLLACRSELGTINHTLLSLEALERRGMEILGCVIIGPPNESNEQAIEHYGDVSILGRIPLLTSFDALPDVYEEHFAPLDRILRA